MPYINTDMDSSWHYSEDYITLMNVQIEIVEAIAWLSQQPPRENQCTDQVFVDIIDPIINKLMDIKNYRQMWLGE